MILTATTMMALQDALVKLLSAGLPLWQFFALRSAIALPVLFVLLRGNTTGLLRLALQRWALLRSALLVAMYIGFYAALPSLDLSVVAACYYTGPLFIVLFSALLLGERPSRRQVFAMAIAFSGVLFVLRPDGTGFSFVALVPVLSAICYALAAVVTRGRTVGIGPGALTVSLNIVFLGIGASGIVLTSMVEPRLDYPFLLQSWAPLHLNELGTLLILCGLSIAIHFALARAYQLGPTVTIAGLDYAYLPFAAFWALLLLGTVPSLSVVIGTTLIVLAGLWTVRVGRAA